VVGAKVFTMAEPHTLVCVDANTGTVLWQRDNNPFELLGLPKDKARELQRVLDMARMAQVLFRRVSAEGGASGAMKDAAKTDAGKARILAYADALAGFEKTAQAIDADLAKGFAGMAVEARLCAANGSMPQSLAIIKAVNTKYGLPCIESWMGMVGWAFATPVSDGARVYVTCGQGQVACYDLEGNRLWGRLFPCKETGRTRVQHVPSPLLVNGVLIAQLTAKTVGMRADTGEVLYEIADGVGGGYRCGSAKALRVTRDGKPEDIFATTAGNVYRASDGRMLCKLGVGMCGSEAGGASVVGSGDLVYYWTGGNGGGPAVCFQLVPVGADALEAKKVWEIAGRNEGSSRILLNGVLVKPAEGLVLEAATGAKLTTMYDGKRFPVDNWPSSIVAGRYLITANNTDGYGRLREDGLLVVPFGVVDLADPKAPKTVTVQNYLGGLNKPRFPEMEALLPDLYAQPYWSNYGLPSQFGSGSWFASGNRLFLRSESHLYCIGDPAVPYDWNPASRPQAMPAPPAAANAGGVKE
jgi:hypothetical protein